MHIPGLIDTYSTHALDAFAEQSLMLNVVVKVIAPVPVVWTSNSKRLKYNNISGGLDV